MQEQLHGSAACHHADVTLALTSFSTADSACRQSMPSSTVKMAPCVVSMVCHLHHICLIRLLLKHNNAHLREQGVCLAAELGAASPAAPE